MCRNIKAAGRCPIRALLLVVMVAGVVGLGVLLHARRSTPKAPVARYHAALREAALAQPWFQTLTLLRTELNCAPQWPHRGHPENNMGNGSVDDCLDVIDALGHCDEMASATGLVLALDSGSHHQERMALDSGSHHQERMAL